LIKYLDRAEANGGKQSFITLEYFFPWAGIQDRKSNFEVKS
jgi:hypothetical protein